MPSSCASANASHTEFRLVWGSPEAVAVTSEALVYPRKSRIARSVLVACRHTLPARERAGRRRTDAVHCSTSGSARSLICLNALHETGKGGSASRVGSCTASLRAPALTRRAWGRVYQVQGLNDLESSELETRGSGASSYGPELTYLLTQCGAMADAARVLVRWPVFLKISAGSRCRGCASCFGE